MNLPVDVPGRLVCLLRLTRLSRPVTDPLELALVVLVAEDDELGTVAPDIKNVFAKARAPEIRKALRRVARYTGNDLQEGRERDLTFLVGFLVDYPGQHEGTIIGLADKSVRWHQRELAQERATTLDRYGAKTRVTMPPIPTPADSAVQLLKTVEEIVREGERMEHCVAAYVPHVLNGPSYLFHVEHEGEAATVMVHRNGQIEAEGPRNRHNSASRWGERRLADWARGLQSAVAQRAG